MRVHFLLVSDLPLAFLESLRGVSIFGIFIFAYRLVYFPLSSLPTQVNQTPEYYGQL